MNLKAKLSLILVYLGALQLVNLTKFEHINDCIFYNKSVTLGRDEITFVCDANDRENKVFTNINRTKCSNTYFDTAYKWLGLVDFKNCRFPQIKRNYFEMFKYMHTFNISNVELQSMELDIFREASNVEKLYLSRNNLTVIPSHIFFNAKKLTFVDFSNNTINRVDAMAFEGATNLGTLLLSHNNISELDSRTLSLPKLLTLDVSYNNFTKLHEHIFDKLTNLELLNLSFNAIGNLDIKIFSYLISLKDLNLKRTNLSNIQLGTFSQQHKLVSLDLSENRLKQLDFKLFLPNLRDLRSLHLGNNQLKNLNGFRNTIFPHLGSLDIQGNQFSCADLANFMEIVNWETIHLSLDANSTALHKSNIRGVDCDDSEDDMGTQGDILIESMNKTAQFDHGYNINSIQDDTIDTSIKISLTFICVALTIFLILFVIVNSLQIYNQFTKILKLCRSIRNHSSDGNVVEYTNGRAFIT